MSVREAKTKADFIQYLDENPEQRFMQAVRNFIGVPFLIASDEYPTSPDQHDTFNWENQAEKEVKANED